jgi:hypothetical protein
MVKPDYTFTTITIKWKHKSWLVRKHIKLSAYLAEKIEKDMMKDGR